MSIAIAAEIRRLEPTEPDERGVRWAQFEATGQARWVCECGAEGEMKQRDRAFAEMHEHEQTCQEET